MLSQLHNEHVYPNDACLAFTSLKLVCKARARARSDLLRASPTTHCAKLRNAAGALRAYRNRHLSAIIRCCGSVWTCSTMLPQDHIRRQNFPRTCWNYCWSHTWQHCSTGRRHVQQTLVADWKRQGLGQMQEKSTCSMCPKHTAHASCADRRRGPSVRRCKWIWRQILCIWGRNSSSTRRRLPGPILRDHSGLRPKGPRRHTVDVMQETIWRNVGCKKGVCPWYWRPAVLCVLVCRGIRFPIASCGNHSVTWWIFFLRQASQPSEKLFPSLLWLMTRAGSCDLFMRWGHWHYVFVIAKSSQRHFVSAAGNTSYLVPTQCKDAPQPDKWRITFSRLR